MPSVAGRFVLYNPSGEPASEYKLQDENGVMVGSIDFAKLGTRYFIPYTSAYVAFYGLPGAVCDGPGLPTGTYRPGQCMSNYVSVRYSDSVPLVMRALEYIRAGIPGAEMKQGF